MKHTEKRVIGITGGVGSGKTAVLDILKNEYGALVIEADKVGHMLQMPGETAYNAIVEAFGIDVLQEPRCVGQSELDRRRLGDIVFADDSKLKILNNIMHPMIHDRIALMIEASDASIIVVEAAILITTSLVELVKEVWYIYCHRNVRIDRLKEYRGYSEEKTLSIMNNQPSEDEFKDKCQVCIDNSGSVEQTREQIIKALDKTYM